MSFANQAVSGLTTLFVRLVADHFLRRQRPPMVRVQKEWADLLGAPQGAPQVGVTLRRGDSVDQLVNSRGWGSSKGHAAFLNGPVVFRKRTERVQLPRLVGPRCDRSLAAA